MEYCKHTTVVRGDGFATRKNENNFATHFKNTENCNHIEPNTTTKEI